MKIQIHKKVTIVLSALATLAFFGSGTASADDWPSKPVTLIIPFGAGGSHDINARVFTSVISSHLGQPMIVKLMPGASGQKGTAAAIKAKPDGYTLLFTHNFIDQLQRHVENLPYDTLKDQITVWKLNESEALLFTKADKPWKTLPDMISYAKQNPGKVVFNNSGKWGASFTPGAVLFAHTGVQIKFAPYKGGGPSRRAILAGDGDFTFGRIGNIASLHEAGKVRILAVAGANRVKAFPDVPSFKELGYPTAGAVMDRIIMAPRGTPADRIVKLQTAFASLYKDKTFKNLMKRLGENLKYVNGPEYEKIRAKQSAEYGALVKKLTAQ
jgi:tripartite-type tricarboxylate transporter receptor subunit TctC